MISLPLRARWLLLLLPLLGLAVLAVVFFVLRASVGLSSFSDPESARCSAPPVAFGPNRILSDHQAVTVHFTCESAILAGTLTLPRGTGPHPAVVWVHGAGASGRLTWSAPLVRAFVRAGVAVLSYDKRGGHRSHAGWGHRCQPGGMDRSPGCG